MSYLKYLPLLFAIGILSYGCVSKKKYEAVVSAKKRSDQRVRELSQDKSELESNLKERNKEVTKLNDQLTKLKEEYNDIKNQMLENNARKTSLIEELNRKLNNLASDKSALRDSLQNVLGRLNKREAAYAEKQRELEKQLKEIEGLQAAIEDYRSRATNIEEILHTQFDKHNIFGVYTLRINGIVYITFDKGMLFEGDGEKLQENGRKALGVIASLMKKSSDIQFEARSNWAEDVEASKAFSTTRKRAAVVFDYLQKAEDFPIQALNVSAAKMDRQELAGAKTAMGFVLYPDLKSLSQFTQ